MNPSSGRARGELGLWLAEKLRPETDKTKK